MNSVNGLRLKSLKITPGTSIGAGWSHWHDRLALAKLPLCLLISFSTFCGYVLTGSKSIITAVVVSTGVFLVGSGAASLNSLQEWRADARMVRTRQRPLPRGTVRPSQAAWQAVILFALGGGLLALLPFWHLPFALSLMTVLLYNGVYTRLKKRTLLAIIPGAICGALPPLIGYLAGGGRLLSTEVALLVVLLLLWQFPHFYLITLQFPGDYVANHQPNLLALLAERAINRLITIWICALALVFLCFTVFPFTFSATVRALLVTNASILVFCGIFRLWPGSGISPRTLFMVLNGTFFCHLLLICIGSLALF